MTNEMEIKLRFGSLTVLVLCDVFQDYTLEGEFGSATDDFSDKGRVVERSTYGRIPHFVPQFYCIYYFCEFFFISLIS